jgi:hypothetical protein
MNGASVILVALGLLERVYTSGVVGIENFSKNVKRLIEMHRNGLLGGAIMPEDALFEVDTATFMSR